MRVVRPTRRVRFGGARGSRNSRLKIELFLALAVTLLEDEVQDDDDVHDGQKLAHYSRSGIFFLLGRFSVLRVLHDSFPRSTPLLFIPDWPLRVSLYPFSGSLSFRCGWSVPFFAAFTVLVPLSSD